jgi:hypothetical protein
LAFRRLFHGAVVEMSARRLIGGSYMGRNAAVAIELGADCHRGVTPLADGADDAAQGAHVDDIVPIEAGEGVC